MALQSMRKFKKLLKQGSGAKMTKADWQEVRGVLGSDAGRGVRKKAANPGKKLTKLQRKVKAAKASANRRVAVALAKYLKQVNPSATHAKVQKLKGGVIKITPIKAKAKARR